jgi:hypothetical protein
MTEAQLAILFLILVALVYIVECIIKQTLIMKSFFTLLHVRLLRFWFYLFPKKRDIILFNASLKDIANAPSLIKHRRISTKIMFDKKKKRFGRPTPLNDQRAVLILTTDGQKVTNMVERKHIKSPTTRKGNIRPAYGRGWSWNPAEWQLQKEAERNRDQL